MLFLSLFCPFSWSHFISLDLPFSSFCIEILFSFSLFSTPSHFPHLRLQFLIPLLLLPNVSFSFFVTISLATPSPSLSCRFKFSLAFFLRLSLPIPLLLDLRLSLLFPVAVAHPISLVIFPSIPLSLKFSFYSLAFALFPISGTPLLPCKTLSRSHCPSPVRPFLLSL